ncbi:hypothetical protein [Paracoccus aestuariivivens]|uniref:Uncharacterized protein n=1 Tax=Paracoccus aestuariivivens TaxID=1820333 RepID=A0A6L6J9Q9_9RHOB|nr:hypothetical protein [Paracoccus aestuariivivens]MTH78822.1 hypothetical protein [Paracoccus aestuariivivens]
MAATQLDPAEARSEARIAAGLFLAVLVLIVIAALATAIWGLAALTLIALAGTVTMFGILIAYAAGF